MLSPPSAAVWRPLVDTSAQRPDMRRRAVRHVGDVCRPRPARSGLTGRTAALAVPVAPGPVSGGHCQNVTRASSPCRRHAWATSAACLTGRCMKATHWPSRLLQSVALPNLLVVVAVSMPSIYTYRHAMSTHIAKFLSTPRRSPARPSPSATPPATRAAGRNAPWSRCGRDQASPVPCAHHRRRP